MTDSGSKKTHIVKSAAALSIVSGFSLIFSFLQESVFAYFYGANNATDAYYMATQIPVTLFALISTAISTVVIPCYSNELYKKGKEAAERYASNFMSSISIITIVAIILGEIFAHFVLLVFAPGMETATRELSTFIFRLVLPTILLTELMNINTGVMNVHKSFVLPAMTSNILNIAFVSSVFVLANRVGIYAAVIGTIVGTVLEFVYSIIIRRKYMKYRYIFDIKDEGMKTSVKMAGPVFIGIGAAEINKIIDRVVASFLTEGSITILNYAAKLSSAVSTLFITGLTTVVYPEFSEKTAEEDDKGVADVMVFAINMLLIIIVPIIAGGFVLGEDIIKIVYGRGKFSNDLVYKTAPIFVCYLFSLIFVSTRQVASRLFYSYKDSKTPMKNSIIGIIINIILNIVLGKLMGAIGLALATTISAGVISFLLLVDAKKRNAYLKYKSIALVGIKSIIASTVMALIVWLVKRLFILKGYYNLDMISRTVVVLLIAVMAGAAVYLVMLFVLRVSEAKKVLEMIKDKRKK